MLVKYKSLFLFFLPDQLMKLRILWSIKIKPDMFSAQRRHLTMYCALPQEICCFAMPSYLTPKFHNKQQTKTLIPFAFKLRTLSY